MATLEKLGDTDCKKVTAAEKWTVGVTAHHLAGAPEAVAGIVTGIVSGAPSPGNFTRAKEFGASVPQLVPWKRFGKAEEVAPVIRLLGLQASKLRDSGAVHDGRRMEA